MMKNKLLAKADSVYNAIVKENNEEVIKHCEELIKWYKK